MSKIGKNIRKIRATKGLSQTAFANLFNLTRASIGAYEEGRAEPKTDTTLQIAKHFSIPVEALLAEELTVNRLTNFNLKSVLSKSQSKNEIPVLFINKGNWKSFINRDLVFHDFSETYPASFLTGDFAFEIHEDINSPFATGTIITCSECSNTKQKGLYLHISAENAVIEKADKISFNSSTNDMLFRILQKIEPVNETNENSVEARLTVIEKQLNISNPAK